MAAAAATTAGAAASAAGGSSPQSPVRPGSAGGNYGWFHQHKESKPKLPLVGTAAPVVASVAAHAPPALAAAGAGAGEAQPAQQQQPVQHHNSFNNRFAFVNMKGFWESLRTWASFKHYLRGLRDLVLIAKPVEHFLLKTGVRSRGRCIRSSMSTLTRQAVAHPPKPTRVCNVTQAIHDRDLSRFIGKAVSFMLYSVVVTSVLGTFGIDTKPLITGIGISGFVVGFALKEIATK